MPRHLMNTKQTSRDTSNKKVFVGLSGGVDSAVTAALLLREGFDVTGVFIKVWSPEFLPCTWRDERRDAMRVAAHLGIPFLFFDFEKEYKEGVADYMIEGYKIGLTPNPDVMCNREIKFGIFWKKSKQMGADFIATGHYAQNIEASDNIFHLLEGKDSEKDQSYFLWTLRQDDLKHVLFPVGHLDKSEVRKLAKQFGLPVSDKKDSQGICFLGDVSLEEFLPHFIDIVPGDVLDTKNNKIGTHKGAAYYTLGERHGFTITKKTPEDGAFYVVSKDIKKNTITVSDDEAEIVNMSPKKIKIKNINWITQPNNLKLTARIRYRGEKIPVSIVNGVAEWTIPMRGVSLGQSIVFYDGEICVGGGVVEKILS